MKERFKVQGIRSLPRCGLLYHCYDLRPYTLRPVPYTVCVLLIPRDFVSLVYGHFLSSCLLYLCGQFNDKSGSARFSVLNTNATVMVGYYRVYDSKAQTGPLFFG